MMRNHIKCRRPIAFFAWAALICTALHGVLNLHSYDFDDVVFYTPNITGLVFLLFDLAPCVLLILYIEKFHGQYKGAVLYPIACGIIAAYPLLTTLFNVIRGVTFHWESFLPNLAVIVPFALLAVQAAKGLRKKGYLIAAVSIGIALQLLLAAALYTAMAWYITTEQYLFPIGNLLGVLGSISQYLALLLFGLNNKIPVLTKEGKSPEALSPEQALRLLSDKLELGIITEEEYREQRAQILRKL